ncbi:hypothetical protein [Pseudomonas phage UF_RH7]|nr:hypothetical protein [Pseudomonas phage UF_RH7]
MSIEIRVADAYVITSDKYQFILHQLKEKGLESKNPGEETRALVGFYPTIRHLVTGMLQNELLESTACDLQEMQWLLEETAEKCQGSFNYLATQAALHGVEAVFPASVKPPVTQKGAWQKAKDAENVEPKLPDSLQSRLLALPMMDEKEGMELLADLHAWAFPPAVKPAAAPAPEEDDEL